MPKKYSLALALLLCSSLCCHAEQGRNDRRTVRYSISSRGLSVGEMTTVISPEPHAGDRAVRFKSDLAIDANLLLFKVNSMSREDAVISEHGTLSYHRLGQDNGKSQKVDAALEGGNFHFRLTDNGVLHSVSVPRASYDYTTLDCPETTMQREGDTLEVRLLDMERGSVIKRTFHWVKSEEMVVGGKRLRCRVVDFTDPDNKCRRWVSTDEHGVVIVRQEGRGKRGSYSLRMVSVADGPG